MSGRMPAFCNHFVDQYESVLVTDVFGDGNCLLRAIAACMGMNEKEFESIRKAMYEEINTHRLFYKWVSDTELDNEYLPRLTTKGVAQLRQKNKSVWLPANLFYAQPRRHRLCQA